MQTMGERLKWARKQFDWTQADLAKRAGVNISTVRRIEQEKFNLRLDTISRIAGTLSVREAWLAYGEEPMVSLADMTGDEQVRAQTGPGTEGLPGFVVIEGGPWYRDGETWRVDGVEKGIKTR